MKKVLAVFLMLLPSFAFAESWHSEGKFDRTYWDDLRMPGLSTQQGASAPDLVAYGPSGGLLCKGFDGGVTLEQVYSQGQLPHAYEPGTDLRAHIHWTPTTAGAGNIEWNLEYSWTGVNETAGAPTTIQCQDSTNSNAWDHLIASCGTISNSGSEGISSMITVRVYRDPTDADDTYAADACLKEIDFHFETTSPGSRQEYIK